MGWNDNLSDPNSYADYYPHLAPPLPRFPVQYESEAEDEE